MNTPSNRSDQSRGEASGQSQPLRRDEDSKQVKQRLDDVGLEDRGDMLEDEQRDRRSSGRPPEPPPDRSSH